MGRETFSVESYRTARRDYGVTHDSGVTRKAEQRARDTGHLSEIVDPAVNPMRFSKIRLNPHQKKWIATLGCPMDIEVSCDTTGSMGGEVDTEMAVLPDLYEAVAKVLPGYDPQLCLGIFGDVCDDFIDTFRELLLTKSYFNLDDWYTALGVETKQGMIYEKESSEILRKLNLKSFGEGYKVMIIWQPQKMNTTCANKLLKILEEPPQRTIFLLVSEQPEQLLSTILSRVQQIRVPRLSDDEIRDGLIANGYEAQNATDWAHIANGSYLNAIKLAGENSTNSQYLSDFIELMRNAYTIGHINDASKKLSALQNIRKWSLGMADAKKGREKQRTFLQYVQRQVRENYVFNLQHPELNYQTKEERDFSQRFSPYINASNVEQIMLELDKAERQIAQNGNAKIIFFDMCLQFIVLLKR